MLRPHEQQKLDRIKAQIDAGEYDVPGEEIAGAMLSTQGCPEHPGFEFPAWLDCPRCDAVKTEGRRVAHIREQGAHKESCRERQQRERQTLLEVIDALGDNAYGVPVCKELSARLGQEVSFGTLYSMVDRLEAEGLIGSRWGAGTAERGWRPKKYFYLIPAIPQASAMEHDTEVPAPFLPFYTDYAPELSAQEEYAWDRWLIKAVAGVLLLVALVCVWMGAINRGLAEKYGQEPDTEQSR